MQFSLYICTYIFICICSVTYYNYYYRINLIFYNLISLQFYILWIRYILYIEVDSCSLKLLLLLLVPNLPSTSNTYITYLWIVHELLKLKKYPIINFKYFNLQEN